jgi:hypothetical protein
LLGRRWKGWEIRNGGDSNNRYPGHGGGTPVCLALRLRARLYAICLACLPIASRYRPFAFLSNVNFNQLINPKPLRYTKLAHPVLVMVGALGYWVTVHFVLHIKRWRWVCGGAAFAGQLLSAWNPELIPNAPSQSQHSHPFPVVPSIVARLVMLGQVAAHA